MKECPKCDACYPDAIEICPADGEKTRFAMTGTPILAKRYVLKKRLGRGAMGQVYLAGDNRFEHRNVAVKTVRPDILSSDNLQEGEAIARFEREAQSAASIIHPNIVSVTDFGESDEGIFYLVMEYVEGETLHRLLRREGTLSIKRAVKILRQICDGVAAAHAKGILHRDLKPANIFLMNTGSGDGFTKVGDFGLAKIVNQTVTDISSDATPSSRGIIGTPEYMAPEQMQPEIGIDHRADIYAVGTIAFMMLGGRTPFSGDLMQLVMQKVMHQAPLLSTLRTDIPADVDKVIASALATHANERPNSITEWIDALEKAAEDANQPKSATGARLVILAPNGAEVYIDDERKGSVGSSGKMIVPGVPPGRHVLRVAKTGDRDDERVIELRESGEDQVIQAHLRQLQTEVSHPSQAGGPSESSMIPSVVACSKCGARFASGVKFCGRCGNRQFVSIVVESNRPASVRCPKCGIELPPNSKFCGRCGTNTSSVNAVAGLSMATVIKSVERICRKCGSSFPPNVKFCGKCGGSL